MIGMRGCRASWVSARSGLGNHARAPGGLWIADQLTILHNRATLKGNLMSDDPVMEHMTTYPAAICKGRPVGQGEGGTLLCSPRHSHARMRGAFSEGAMVKSRPAGPQRICAA